MPFPSLFSFLFVFSKEVLGGYVCIELLQLTKKASEKSRAFSRFIIRPAGRIRTLAKKLADRVGVGGRAGGSGDV